MLNAYLVFELNLPSGMLFRINKNYAPVCYKQCHYEAPKFCCFCGISDMDYSQDDKTAYLAYKYHTLDNILMLIEQLIS